MRTNSRTAARRAFPFLLAPALVLAAAAAPPQGPEELELDEAEVFIEYNSTDGDFGIQFFWDGDPWTKMQCLGPNERAVLRVRASRNLARQGLTEGFFESAEPSTDDLTMEQFLARFPEGEYEYEGLTQDGEILEGETEFTHVLPAPPENLWPAEGDVVNAANPLTVTFDAVTEDANGDSLEPELYEVILETENEILRVFSMILEGDVANPAVTIPPQFLTPGTEYKYEVIVQEESHNRTIAETTFCTM